MAAVDDGTGAMMVPALRDRRDAWLDGLFKLAIAACILATLLVIAGNIHGHEIQPAVDLVIDTIAAVVCITLTTLAWARHRERHVIAAAYHAAAFMALSVAYSIAVAISLQQATGVGGLAAPENVQVLVFAVARMAAAILFVIAGAFTRRPSYGWGPVWILAAPTLAVTAAALVGRLLAPPPDALQILIFPDGSGLPQVTPFGALVHMGTSGLFFAGAYVSRGLWRSDRAVIDAWIAVGLLFAGFAELHGTLFPSAHPGQVSTADLLRLACSVCLLAGLAGALRSDQRELRKANAELEELRDAEVERAAVEERARLARELHDGLAQDLWLAKLKTGELMAMEGLPVEARRAAEGAVAAIDVGLSDAREAVAALRSSAHSESGFCSLVRRAVEDHRCRFGLRIEFTFEGDHTTSIDPRSQAEILRITQEALSNAAKHAAATLVGVRLALSEGQISLRIADNGHGFDVASHRGAVFGIASMEERAALIGGRLTIESSPETGTLVDLVAPFRLPETKVDASLVVEAERS